MTPRQRLLAAIAIFVAGLLIQVAAVVVRSLDAEGRAFSYWFRIAAPAIMIVCCVVTVALLSGL